MCFLGILGCQGQETSQGRIAALDRQWYSQITWKEATSKWRLNRLPLTVTITTHYHKVQAAHQLLEHWLNLIWTRPRKDKLGVDPNLKWGARKRCYSMYCSLSIFLFHKSCRHAQHLLIREITLLPICVTAESYFCSSFQAWNFVMLRLGKLSKHLIKIYDFNNFDVTSC